MRPILWLQSILMTVVLANAAVAEPTDPHSGDGNGEHTSPHFFAGAKASYVASFHGEHVKHLGGGGLFVEVLAIEHWLEIELFARILGGGGLLVFPIDLVFKVPFHLNQTVHPFVGLGATVVPEKAHGETEVFFGGLVVAGSYFWLSPSVGLVAEFNYNLVYAHGLGNELGMNGGIVFGW